MLDIMTTVSSATKTKKARLLNKVGATAVIAAVTAFPLVFGATAASAAPNDAYISSMLYNITPQSDGNTKVEVEFNYFAGEEPDREYLTLPPLVRVEDNNSDAKGELRRYEYDGFKTPTTYSGKTIANGGEKEYNPWTVVSIQTDENKRQSLGYVYTVKGAVAKTGDFEQLKIHLLNKYDSVIPVQKIGVVLNGVDGTTAPVDASISTGKTNAQVDEVVDGSNATGSKAFTVTAGTGDKLTNGEIVLDANYDAGTFSYSDALIVDDPNAVAAQDAPTLIDGVTTLPLTAAQKAAEEAKSAAFGERIGNIVFIILILAGSAGAGYGIFIAKKVPQLKRFKGVADGTIPELYTRAITENVPAFSTDTAKALRTGTRSLPPVLDGETLPPAYAILTNENSYRYMGEAFVATILDLADRGYLLLEANSKSTSTTLIRVNTDKSPLLLKNDFERKLVNDIADNFSEAAPAILGADDKVLRGVVFKNFIDNLDGSLKASNLFTKVRGMGEISSNFILFVLSALTGSQIINTVVNGLHPVSAMVVFAGVTLLVIAVLNRRTVSMEYTALGYALAVQSDAFRAYFDKVNRRSTDSIEGKDFNGSYLGWAMIYGHTEKWFQVFAANTTNFSRTEARVEFDESPAISLSANQLDAYSAELNRTATRRGWDFIKEYKTLRAA